MTELDPILVAGERFKLDVTEQICEVLNNRHMGHSDLVGMCDDPSLSHKFRDALEFELQDIGKICHVLGLEIRFTVVGKGKFHSNECRFCGVEFETENPELSYCDHCVRG